MFQLVTLARHSVVWGIGVVVGGDGGVVVDVVAGIAFVVGCWCC